MKLHADRRLLVVDDDPDIRFAFGRVLSAEGYSVHLAADAEEGLRVLTEQPIQLLISDHQMPGMSGIEFLKRARELYPHVLRLIITADPSTDLLVRAINEAEIYRLILKPIDVVRLRVTVQLAFETILLEDEKRRLLEVVRRQQRSLRESTGSADAEGDLILAESDLLGDR